MPAFQFIGSTVSFIREATGVTKASTPDGLSWVASNELGTVTSVSFNPQIEKKELWGPGTTAKLVRKDILETKRALDITIKIEDGGPMFWESVMGTAALSSGSTSYTPGAVRTLKGWIKIAQIDTEANAVNTLYLWGRLSVSGSPSAGGEHTSYDLMFEEIYSATARGTLGSLV